MSDVHETVERRFRQSDDITAHVIKTLPHLNESALRELATLFVNEVGYLGEHFPSERETATRYPCSGQAWHRCSFGGPHQQGCKAIGGSGELVGGGERGRSCETDCDTAGDEEPWCDVNGFDCPECELFDCLLALLAREGHNFSPPPGEAER